MMTYYNLNNGISIPVLGFGTWKAENGEIAYQAVLEALKTPICQIAENAGFDGNEILEKQLSEKKGIGFNAKNGEWVNLYKTGIIDPTKVTRSALLNAASISGLFLTTEAAIAELPSKESPLPQMPQY